ncbi:hypothetical protein, partial [Klebsiella pneumoniae]|uniref:hypothetical protein n=1 Tax=Klebsiella pneumoniae TaxID=573 RepID=UPI00163D7A91
GSVQGSGHFASSGSSTALYSELQSTDSYQYAVNYDNFEIRKKNVTNVEYFVFTSSLDTGETVHIYSEVADVENIVDVAGRVYTVISILMVIV